MWEYRQLGDGSWQKRAAGQRSAEKEVQKSFLCGELGITAWVGRFPLGGRKDHQELCSSQRGLWGLSFTSPVPQPAEGLLTQIRAAFHTYDPETSPSRANLQHERYNVMS